MNCEVCGKNLTGRQTKFCSKACKLKVHAKWTPDKQDKLNEKRLNLKLELIKDLGGKCSICGYDKNYAALEFHHSNPNEKEFTVSKWIYSYKNSKIKDEVEKCILVCANCHRELHNPRMMSG